MAHAQNTDCSLQNSNGGSQSNQWTSAVMLTILMLALMQAASVATIIVSRNWSTASSLIIHFGCQLQTGP